MLVLCDNKEMKKNLNFILGIVVLILLGSALVYGKNIFKKPSEENSADNISEEYKKNFEAATKKVAEEEYGIPVKTELMQQLPENMEGKKWAIAISINSLNADLVLMEDQGQTPWMDHKRIDTELKEFEKAEKENLSSKTAGWQTIINDSPLSQKMIEQINTVLIPQWEAGIKDLKDRKQKTEDINAMLTERFGVGVNNIPQKYSPLYQYNKDIGFILLIKRAI